tara:strand:- start:1570 stop:1878 length:309 start_codon:yes stop_codon:yes gene_type:complete
MNPLAKMAFNMVMKQLFKKFDLNKINKYVNEDNELDKQMKVARKTLNKYGKTIEELEKDMAVLKKDSHPPVISQEELSAKLNQKDEWIKNIFIRLNELEKKK